MIMPMNKELYIKMFHKVWIEKLQNYTGGQEEAIKNVSYWMALCHLFSAGLFKRESFVNFPILLSFIFQSTVLPYKM